MIATITARVKKAGLSGLFLVSLLICGAAQEARALDAGDWMELNEERKRGYVIATIDTWYNFYGLIKDHGKGERSYAEQTFYGVVECINRRKFSYDQIYLASVSYVDRRKDRRQYTMAAVVWNTVTEMCEKK